MSEIRGSDCPDTLHDWPLPTRYVAASSTADARLAAGWKNPKCPDCGLYGWVPSSKMGPSTRPLHVVATR